MITRVLFVSGFVRLLPYAFFYINNNYDDKC